jgi:FAD dependent oxidoreductase
MTLSTPSGFSARNACDVLVIGDEVESILTAVSAARAGAKVFLARRSLGHLGGLSVRGGLSYMDITPECITGLFAEFLQRAGVIRVALNPDRAHRVLHALLTEAHVEVVSGVDILISLTTDGFPEAAYLRPGGLSGSTGSSACCDDFKAPKTEQVLRPTVVIDATPDADTARALGVPHITGLGGLFGQERNFLGISPVFRLAGIPVADLQVFEQGLRETPGLAAVLEKALPLHPRALRSEYLTRPTFAPADQDYLDILNPVIGIDYHCWRHGDAATYPDAGIFIDGANISRLSDGTLGFNGLVAQPGKLGLGCDDLVALSQGAAIPEVLQQELGFVERYFRERAGFESAQVIAPEEMYIRQTFTLLAQHNMTAKAALLGGVPGEQAVGSFSYWLDLRGAPLWQIFPGVELPKPFFNVGLSVALPDSLHTHKTSTALQNIGFISRSAGYSPIGQGAGRIVQHNAMVGEGLGIAAAIAAAVRKPLTAVAKTELSQIQEVLKTRYGKLTCEGHPVTLPKPDESPVTHALLEQEAAVVTSLRKAAAVHAGAIGSV